MANITRRQSEAPLSSLRREIDQLFDTFFTAPLAGALTSMGREFNPVLEISEKDDEYVMAAELPGVDEKNVEVEIDENVLTIRGEKKREERQAGKGYQYTERSYGAFVRSVQLPPGTDPDKVRAEFKDGVLEIHIPKSPAHARHIPIGKAQKKELGGAEMGSKEAAEATPEMAGEQPGGGGTVEPEKL